MFVLHFMPQFNRSEERQLFGVILLFDKQPSFFYPSQHFLPNTENNLSYVTRQRKLKPGKRTRQTFRSWRRTSTRRSHNKQHFAALEVGEWNLARILSPSPNFRPHPLFCFRRGSNCPGRSLARDWKTLKLGVKLSLCRPGRRVSNQYELFWSQMTFRQSVPKCHETNPNSTMRRTIFPGHPVFHMHVKSSHPRCQVPQFWITKCRRLICRACFPLALVAIFVGRIKTKGSKSIVDSSTVLLFIGSCSIRLPKFGFFVPKAAEKGKENKNKTLSLFPRWSVPKTNSSESFPKVVNNKQLDSVESVI